MKNLDTHAESYRLLGLNISHYRRRLGLSQIQLAEKVGISRQHLGNIEAPNMSTPFTTTVLFNIADVLGVSLKDLFNF